MEIGFTSFLETLDDQAWTYPLIMKPGARLEEIRNSEQLLGVKFPTELVQFYLYSNGAEGNDFAFNILALSELRLMVDDQGQYLEFSEYLLYSETCGIVIDTDNPDNFSIVRRIGSTPIGNYHFPQPICFSLQEYLVIYCNKGTFGIWT